MEYIFEKYYENPSLAQDAFDQRFNFEATLKTNLPIKYSDAFDSSSLYFVFNNYTMMLIDKIRQNDFLLRNLEASLPSVARKNYIVELIASEVHYTSSVENVESDRGEILDITRKTVYEIETTDNSYSKMIEYYRNLIDMDKIYFPKHPKGIRELYDLIIASMVSRRNQPDGELFRTNEVYMRRRGDSKGGVTHLGVDGEDNIFSHLSILINFCNDESIAPLLRAGIFYYYFEYIRPFYTGNDRLNRYIVSSFLRNYFSHSTSLCVARGTYFMLTDYYRVVNTTMSKVNLGELNYFIDFFCQSLIRGQESAIHYLKRRGQQLRDFYNKIEADSDFDSTAKVRIMKLLAQNFLFYEDNIGFSKAELLEATKNRYSEEEILKSLEDLLSNKFVYIMDTENNHYRVHEDYLKKLNLVKFTV